MWLFKWIFQLRDMSNCLGLYASHCQYRSSSVLSNDCIPSFSRNTKIKSNCSLTYKNSTRHFLWSVVGPHTQVLWWTNIVNELQQLKVLFMGIPSFQEHCFYIITGATVVYTTYLVNSWINTCATLDKITFLYNFNFCIEYMK